MPRPQLMPQSKMKVGRVQKMVSAHRSFLSLCRMSDFLPNLALAEAPGLGPEDMAERRREISRMFWSTREIFPNRCPAKWPATWRTCALAALAVA